MAGELAVQHPLGTTGLTTVYALLWDATNQIVTASSGAVGAYSAGSYANYPIACTEKGALAKYVCAVPSGLTTAGDYTAHFFTQVGGSPAEGDRVNFLGSMDVQWSGTAIVPRSSRMATYTQPTGFLAATFPGTVASTTNITAGTMTTVTTATNLTNAPTSGDLTATMKTSVTTAASAATPALSAGGVTAVVTAVWAALTSALVTSGSIGKYLIDTLTALLAGVNVTQLAGSTTAASKLKSGAMGIVTGVIGTGSTNNVLVFSSFSPAITDADQWKGRFVTFDSATATAGLQGQSAQIQSMLSDGTTTLSSNLTATPAAGDIAAIC